MPVWSTTIDVGVTSLAYIQSLGYCKDLSNMSRDQSRDVLAQAPALARTVVHYVFRLFPKGRWQWPFAHNRPRSDMSHLSIMQHETEQLILHTS